MHTERLEHHKVLSGQGTEAREAATACSNSSDTGLTYLRRDVNIVLHFEDITLKIMHKHE